MKIRDNQFGVSAAEALLITGTVIILSFTGYFVYRVQQNISKTLNDTNKVGQSAIDRSEAALNFAGCKQAADSRLLETYPEQCVTKEGKTFTDTSETVTQPALSKAPADSPTPAAGTCETTSGTVVTVTLTEGVPSPRCSQVAATQTLSVVNPTTKTVTVTLGGQSVTIPADKSGAIATPFGGYLQTGDHVIQTGLYGGSGPEVYLPPAN